MNTRVTREDWLRTARTALVEEGVERVKIAPLATRLDVARSSFYWYFADRESLLAALLDEWEAHNTHSIQQRAARSATTITQAVLHVFECWADPQLFDAPLEFAVREWARRDDAVRDRLAAADAARIAALAAMHVRFGDDRRQALVHARVHFHSQLGLYAMATDEPHAERLRLLPAYVRVFTGVEASPAELRAFERFVGGLSRS
jgi:AcrR family transcriptional regulator